LARLPALARFDDAVLTGDFDRFAVDFPEALEVETAFFGLDCARVRFESLSLIESSFKEAC
jgi:hypothetical protein